MVRARRSRNPPAPRGVDRDGGGEPRLGVHAEARGLRRQLNPWKIFDLPELVTASHK